MTGIGIPFNSRSRYANNQHAAFPGYISGRFYPVNEGNVVAAAVAAADLLYVYPFRVYSDIVPSAISIRCTTGGASSEVKMGVWANNPATGRPTGLPLAGLVSNTGQSTVTSSTNPSIATTGRLSASEVYWFGSVFKATLPSILGLTTPSSIMSLLGRTSMGNVMICGLSTAFVESGDITALSLTGVTWTDVNANGVPLAFLTAP